MSVVGGVEVLVDPMCVIFVAFFCKSHICIMIFTFTFVTCLLVRQGITQGID
jgi:hypothetical protein